MSKLNDNVNSIRLLTHNISPRFQEGLNLLNPSKGDIVLDAGCGEFAGLEKFLACQDIEILALDINRRALIKVERDHLLNVHFVVADVTALPVKSKCISKIVALELVEHLPKGKEACFFKEANRIIKKNGVLVISVPNYSSFLINMLDPHWLMGHRHYKLKTLEEMLVCSGFKIQIIRMSGGIIDALCYLIYLSWHFFWSHLYRKKEPPLPFQTVINKLSTVDYSRLGVYSTHIFLRATKVNGS